MFGHYINMTVIDPRYINNEKYIFLFICRFGIYLF